jgi:hypothetical protein
MPSSANPQDAETTVAPARSRTRAAVARLMESVQADTAREIAESRDAMRQGLQGVVVAAGPGRHEGRHGSGCAQEFLGGTRE